MLPKPNRITGARWKKNAAEIWVKGAMKSPKKNHYVVLCSSRGRKKKTEKRSGWETNKKKPPKRDHRYRNAVFVDEKRKDRTGLYWKKKNEPLYLVPNDPKKKAAL